MRGYLSWLDAKKRTASAHPAQVLAAGTLTLLLASILVYGTQAGQYSASSSHKKGHIDAAQTASWEPLQVRGKSTARTDIQASSQSDGSVRATMTVNDQTISLPANGSIHTSVENDGSARLDVHISSETSGSMQSDSRTSIQLNTTTDTEQVITNSE